MSYLARRERETASGGSPLTRRPKFGEISKYPCRAWRFFMSEPRLTAMSNGRPKRGVPEGLWIRCPSCKAAVFRKEAEARYNVCPDCDHHFYVPARTRIQQLLDEDSFEEWFAELQPKDALEFKDRVVYAQRILAEQAKTGMNDAAVVGRGYIRGRPVV